MQEIKSDSFQLHLLNTCICRTPVFSPLDQLENKWDELKELIKFSSPTFYQLIANCTMDDLGTLSPKIHYTIWKYFNRARYRSTPFGKLAAISLIQISAAPETPVILEDTFSVHEFIDWKDVCQRSLAHNTNVTKARWLVANSTIYTVETNIRYIRRNKDFFELAVIAGFIEMFTVLTICRKKITREALFKKMTEELGMKAPEIKQLLSQMLALQLLFSENEVNITGEDYAKRIGLKSTNVSSNYIISERRLVSGTIAGKEMKEIPQLIKFLAKHVPDTENKDLSNFRKAFLQKFDHRLIPLMTALDLELGVGYGNFGKQQVPYDLIDQLDISRASEKKQQHIPYTELHRFLIDKLMSGSPIRLEEFTTAQQSSNLPLPNTFNVLLHFYDKHSVIENMGGCTASALLGRFTMASHELENFALQITDSEQQANPGILFFDVAYHLENEVDNVNRRKQLYPYELPLMCWSCSSEPLFLEDIWVTVRGAEIILWSKAYNKRMVPRIPSAYNYSRSDFGLFRFLCDLQHQHIKSDLNFQLPFIFPELDYYPRVCFKNVIVSPASWKLPDSLLRSIQTKTKPLARELLNEWLDHKGINHPFTAGHSDQKLYFNPAEEADMDAFLSYCRQYGYKPVNISEALISDHDVKTNKSGKKHMAQFVASYGHGHRIYESPNLELPANGFHQSSIVPPGNDWLYFEIYCHPVRANEILLNEIRPLLVEIKMQIDKWFFIRYDDPMPHIRLRLHLRNPIEGYPIMGKIRSRMEPYLKTGLIADLQVKTYFRETWRYGDKRIGLTENLFFQDSKYVMGLLSQSKNLDSCYSSTLLMMSVIAALVFNESEEQFNFAKSMADGFSQELGMRRASFKLLNQRFEALKRDHLAETKILAFRLSGQLLSAYSRLFGKCNDLTDRRKLLADVFHMHINRLFTSDQRRHEGILYQYLVKFMLRQRLHSGA